MIEIVSYYPVGEDGNKWSRTVGIKDHILKIGAALSRFKIEDVYDTNKISLKTAYEKWDKWTCDNITLMWFYE